MSFYPNFFVVRHSERLDESHPKEWEQLIKSTYGGTTVKSVKSRDGSSALISKTGKSRPSEKIVNFPQIANTNRKSEISSSILRSSSIPETRSSSTSTVARRQTYFAADPPLSPVNGLRYADQAAESLSRMIGEIQLLYPAMTSIKLYSSRLQRAVQTAVPIARRLRIPIHLSLGLSTVINAVKRSKGAFEFQSPFELSQLYPDLPEDIEHYLPTDSWINSIHTIIQRSSESQFTIIVGHRETIRGLAGEHVNTPYCAIATFDRSLTTPPAALESSKADTSEVGKKSSKMREGPLYRLDQLLNCEGRRITR